MENYSRTLDDMDEQDREKTLQFVSVLADPLTRRIMAKLASKHSPIAVNNVPAERLNTTKPQIISRLCRLERYGLVTSHKKTTDNVFYKEYSINENGRRWVDGYMRDELGEFP